MISALRQIYQTKDYRFINLLFLGDDDRDFLDLTERMGLPEMASDPRYATAQLRMANSDAMQATTTTQRWRMHQVRMAM